MTQQSLLFLMLLTVGQSFAQIGINTTTPATNLQVTGNPADSATPDGITMPSLTADQLIAKSNFGAYGANQTGSFVYVTSVPTGSPTAGPSTVNVTAPGFYYFDGVIWLRIIEENSTPNIYTEDGTLAVNRIVTQGANTLDFTANSVDAFAVDGTTFSVDALNNRVGIGTTSPTQTLDVRGDIAAGYTGGSVGLTLNDGGGNANLTFNHIGQIPDRDGNAGRITVNVDTSSNPDMAFELAEGVTAGVSVGTTEYMNLNPDRLFVNTNVGIGTATPLAALDLQGEFNINTGRGNVLFENNANSNSNGAGVTLRTTNNPTNGSIFDIRSSGQASRFFVGQSITSPGVNPFYFGYSGVTGSEFNSAGYASVLNSNGDVGIGTTSPTQPLDVAGNISLRNELVDSDGSAGTNGQFLGRDPGGVVWQNLPASQDPLTDSATNTISGTEVRRAALTGDVTAALNSNDVQINEAAVGSLEIENNSITAGDIGPDAINVSELNAGGGSPGQALIRTAVSNQIRWQSFQSVLTNSTTNTISGTEVRRAALTGDVTAGLNSNDVQINEAAVGSFEIADNSITAGDIGPGAINVSELNAGVGSPGQVLVRTATPNELAWQSTGNTLYNVDGTLTGPRTVSMGANSLTFSQADETLTINNSGNVIAYKEFFGGSYGDVKTSLRTTDHEGWYIANGRACSTFTAGSAANLQCVNLFGGNMPNLNNAETTYLGSDTDETNGAFFANTNDSRISLTASQLPIHQHTVNPPNTATTSNGSHDHGMFRNNVGTNATGTTSIPAVSGGGGGDAYVILSGGAGTAVGRTFANGDHTHSVDIAQFNSGDNVGTTGTEIDIRPKTYNIKYFVYLGRNL